MMETTWKRWTKSTFITDDELVDEWSGLIGCIATRVARSYHLSQEDREDVRSDLVLKLVGLAQAKRPFEGYIKTVLSNAARTSIERVMSRGGHKTRWREFETLSFPAAAGDSQENPSPPEDALGRIVQQDSPEASFVNSVDTQKLLDRLDPAEKDLIVARFWGGQTTPELAVERGLSTSRINFLIQRALAKMRS